MITKFNKYKMNEEYGLPIDRTKQQFMIQQIAKNINPNFQTMFDQTTIHITLNQKTNYIQFGKRGTHLNLHNVSDSLLELIQLEKELIENGIINKQDADFFIDMSRTKLSFSIHE